MDLFTRCPLEKIRGLVYLGLFAFAVTIFLIHYVVSGQAVYGDGIGYYAHLHSWVIDGDWDYTNEYKHIYDHEHNNANTGVESSNVQIVSVAKNGKAENFYGTGVALILLPFYLLAHLLSVVANYLGANLSVEGYSDVYQIISGIGAIFYAITGVYFLEKIINLAVSDEKMSLISSVTLFLSSSLLYYGSFDVINSHFASFCLATIFFYYFLSYGNRNSLLFGLIAGLMSGVRVQDSVIVIIWAISFWKNTNLFWKKLRKFVIGFSFALIPTMIHWYSVFGNPLEHTYLRSILNTYKAKTTPDILGSLFDPTTGLFIRTPLLLILFLFFLYLSWKKEIKLLFHPFVFFLLQFAIITIQGGWAAAAFGGRMYMSSLTFFGILLGMMVLRCGKKGTSRIYLILLMFIILNFFSMAHFILRDKGAEGGLRGTEKRTQQRIQRILLNL